MTEEDRNDFVKSRNTVRWVFILAFFTLLVVSLTLQKCTNDKYNVLKGQSIELQKVYEEQLDGVLVIKKHRLLELDSLTREIKKREDHNILLRIRNDILETRVDSIKKGVLHIPQNNDSLAKFYNTRYKTKDTEVIQNKIALSNSSAQKVSGELQEFDSALKIITIKDEIIFNKDSEILNLKKDSKDYITQIGSLNTEVKAQDELQISAQKNIDNFKSQVKTLKTKNNINKFLLPAAVIAGGFAGYQIAK